MSPEYDSLKKIIDKIKPYLPKKPPKQEPKKYTAWKFWDDNEVIPMPNSHKDISLLVNNF